jgi:thiazole synthase ThiGH ThiG subunit
LDFLEIIIEQSNVPVVVDAGMEPRRMLQKQWKWEQMQFW